MMREEGFDYSFNPSACSECQGKCCTGESGNIFATKKEFEAMASFLKMPMNEFIETYLVKVKTRFSLKEKRYNESYDCIFYDRATNGCGIYEVRPLQCRTFPFWDYFKTHKDELKQECIGVEFDEDK